MNTRKTLVLLSGGMDSTICLYWAKKYFKEVIALTIDREQTSRWEITLSLFQASQLKIPWHLIHVGGLKDGPKNTKEDPDNSPVGDQTRGKPIPGRNFLLLSLARLWIRRYPRLRHPDLSGGAGRFEADRET